MKVNKILLGLLLTITFIACKNEEKQEIKEVKKDIYKLTLNAVVKKDDTFQVFYKDSNDTKAPFEETKSVSVNLKGSETAQNIVFDLPEDVYPTELRFDFGFNKEQDEIVVNEFKIEFLDKNFIVKGGAFFDYFIAEKAFVSFDKATSTAKPILTKDGAYDPMFFSEVTLNGEMIKLSK